MMPDETLTIYAGIFCKVWRIPAALTMLDQHVHDYPHITILMSGRMRVFSEGVDTAVEAPALIKIAADRPHSFLSLTDDVTLACVHGVAETRET